MIKNGTLFAINFKQNFSGSVPTQFIILIISLISIASCARPWTLIENQEVKLRPTKQLTFCPAESFHNNIVSEEELSLSSYETLLLGLKKEKLKLKSIDLFVLWSMVQMLHRPDLASPTARLQTVITVQGDQKYWDFFTNENLMLTNVENSPKLQQTFPYPFIYGLETLLKHYGSVYTLEKLARYADQYVAKNLEVSEGFEKFLLLHEPKLKHHDIFQSTYFRGDQLLSKRESYIASSISKIVKSYEQSKKNPSFLATYQLNEVLFSYQKNNSAMTLKCNFDLSLYDNNIFLIDSQIYSGHHYGFETPQFNALAYSTQKFIEPEPLLGTAFIKGHSNTTGAVVCFGQSPSMNQQLTIFSSLDLDPGQHINHLIQYGLLEANKLEHFNHLIQFSRYLFLVNPTRLLYESGRGKPEQIESLLKLNLNLFHAPQLGKIWMHAQTNSGEKSFIVDDRLPSRMSCHGKL
jgi:hypothetical protein